MKLKNITNIFLLLFPLLSVWAQQPVSSVVDSTDIKIGSSFIYTIQANTDEGVRVVFPDAKMIGPFEVLEAQPIDTILAEKRVEYIKKYMLTQFDSGAYTLPRLSVFVNGKNYQTDLHNINVHNIQVDSLKQGMYDIKANLGSSTDTSSLLYYLLAIVLCIVVGVIVYLIIKNIQKKNLTEDDLFRTPLEKASKKLEELDGKRLVMDGNVKAYYSEMTDITREYIEEIFEIPAKESTSSELVQLLNRSIKAKKIKLSKEIIADLKRVLQTADLVKFAKGEPNMSEIEADRKKAAEISVEMDKAIPKFAEEQSARVRLREQRYRKRKNIRIWVPIGATAVLLLVTAIVYVFNSVADGLKINLFESNKRILNREWVTSEYGFPSVKIETPEAMTRVAVPTAKAGEESPQANFVYQNIVTNLMINLSTTAVQTDENTDLEQIFNRKIQLLQQSLGAKDVKSEAEKFNQEGIEGLRGAGTFSAVRPGSVEEELYQFEIYIFLQKNGVQEISVIYENGDENGEKIARRVFESTQLNVSSENE